MPRTITTIPSFSYINWNSFDSLLQVYVELTFAWWERSTPLSIRSAFSINCATKCVSFETWVGTSRPNTVTTTLNGVHVGWSGTFRASCSWNKWEVQKVKLVRHKKIKYWVQAFSLIVKVAYKDNKTSIHWTPGIGLFKNSYKISLIQHFEAKTIGTKEYRYLLGTSRDGLS